MFNDAYAPHAATLAASLAQGRGPEPLRMTVLADASMSPLVRESFAAFLDSLGIVLDLVQVPPVLVERLPRSGSYPAIIWYRLLLPQLLPDCERVLYLDTDTLAMHSLLPLFMQDLGSDLLGAVASPTSGWEWHCQRLGLDPASGYFNSGVLLMNLEAMRSTEFTGEALATAFRHEDVLISPDQDVLNITLEGRWRKLHPRWNATSYLWLEPDRADDAYSTIEHLSARQSPAIVHFEGSKAIKPWYYRSVHPMRDTYRMFREQTPWPLTALEDRSPAEAMLRLLPIKHQHVISRWKSRFIDLVRK